MPPVFPSPRPARRGCLAALMALALAIGRPAGGAAPPVSTWTGVLRMGPGGVPEVRGRPVSRDPLQALLPGWARPMDRLVEVAPCATTAGQGPPPPYQGVDCPLASDEGASCLSDCAGRSLACDRGAEGRGRLRVCGSRRLSCRQSCEATGEPAR
jgi:hypothetical protein